MVFSPSSRMNLFVRHEGSEGLILDGTGEHFAHQNKGEHRKLSVQGGNRQHQSGVRGIKSRSCDRSEARKHAVADGGEGPSLL